ncbi:MAG: rRNA pseudouridine synthase [Anaerolineae bacterium]|nr:rRNA pseudouridine synthase [Anaerolineae bacterium]
MAQANLGSRRACEDIIRQGRVRVNGQIIHLGDQADPHTDVIEVDGNKLAFADKHIYIAFNKPKQVVSSNVRYPDDDRRTVREMIPVEGHLFTIGRLDADSEGLIILTNDGDLANQLSHPSYHHTKTYKVVVQGLPSEETIQRWQDGIYIQDEDTGKEFKTRPCYVKIVDGGKETTLRIVMTEGKKRQIRRVASIFGHPVKSLVRTHIGTLPLGTLRPGDWRELTAKDIAALKTPADELKRAGKRPKVRTMRPAKETPVPERTGKQPSRSRPADRPSRPSRRPTDQARKPGSRRNSKGR